MTLTQYAKFRIADTLRGWISNWPASEWPHIFGSGRATSSGVSVSEETALNYSAVWAAVSIISADIASLPLVLYKRTPNGGKERYVDSRLYEILHDAPNPEMTAMVFREAMQAHVLTWGNAYAEIERDTMQRPVALWPITPNRVTPMREGGQLRYRVTNPSGGQVFLQPRNMLHIPGLGFDGVVGYSVIQMARESISLGLATEQFGGEFFGNGTTFGGVLSYPQNLTQEVKQGIRESIEAVHGGVDRAHKIAIFGGGAKFEKTGIPPNDAQFLETRKFQITEICRWFGLPPHKLADLERATFSNIEEQGIDYFQSGLRRWCVRWEQEYNRKLISPLERRQQFFKHNAEGILRGNSAARSAFYREMFNIGAYSINMILESEDLNPIGPEGDVHFVQGNLLPADKAMEGPQKPPAVAVEDVTPKPKQLTDGDDDDDDERAMTMLADIATKTAAIEAGFQAQRDAISQAELEQHQQAVRDLTEERDALQRMFDEYRETHAAKAAERQAALEAAQHDADTHRRAQEAAHAESEKAEQARAAAEQQAARESEARAAAEKAADVARTTELNRLTGMLAAHRALIVQVVGRVVRRETDRARRHQATPEKLRQWMESFYVTHEDECVDELKPAIRAHLAWKQSADDVDAVTLALVRAHIAESQRQLRAIVDGEPEEMHAHLERMLTKWEQDRPNALADSILKEEIDHVRTLR